MSILRSLVCGLLLVHSAVPAQEPPRAEGVPLGSPVILSMSYNGELVCTNLQPGSLAAVEWAPSLSGPWTNNWAGLNAVTVASNGTIRVRVPMFYRVLGTVFGPEAIGLGTIAGETGLVPMEAATSTPSIHTNRIDFGAGPDAAELSLLAQRAVELSGAGGSSGYSMAVSYEVLRRAEGVGLLKAGPDILYTDLSGKKTSFLVGVGGVRLGVSVARAVSYPYASPYTVDQARTLLTQKLQDILLSTQNVQQSDRWTKQILHVLAYANQHVSALQEAYASIDLATKANTIVYITCTDGNDQFLY